MDPRTEQAFTREQYDRTVRSEAIPGVGGVAGNTEIMERCAPLAGDPDVCRKMIKIVHRDAPRGVEKTDAPADVKPEPTHKLSETEAITGPVSVTDMIKAAQAQPVAIEDLERGYSGREQAALAKAAAQPKEVTAFDLETLSPALKKAIAEFDGAGIARRLLKRASA